MNVIPMMRKNPWLLIPLAVLFLTNCAPVSQKPPAMAPGPPLSQAPPEGEVVAKKAEQEYKAGRPGTAISLWERIIQTYPNTSLAAKGFHRVGELYLQTGQPERALQYLDYLVYAYPGYEGIHSARLDRLRALAAAGKKKEMMKEIASVWEASIGRPEVQRGISELMVNTLAAEGDIETGFEWASAGFSVARTPEEQKILVKPTMDLLQHANESTVTRLMKKNPSNFMRVFLEYRLVQIESQKGVPEAGKERLRNLLTRNPTHPLASEIQAALREAPSEVETGIHADRVGCLLPLNGQYEKYSRLVLRGLSMAMEDWKAVYPDKMVTLVVKDAPPESDRSVKAFEELVKGDDVIAVIGPLGSQSAKAVSPLADRWGIPMLALTQRDEESADQSFVLHIFLDNHDLVQTLVKYCREKLGYTRFAVLYPDDRYGQRLSKTFSEVVRDQGGNLLASVAYKERSTDFKEPIQRLINLAKQNTPPTGDDGAPFEALFIPDQVQAVSLIAPQLPYYNVVGVTLLGTNLWGEASLVQAGGAYVEHALFATPYFPEGTSPRIRAFSEKYRRIYGSAPSYLEAQAYDAMMLFLQARHGSRSSSMDRKDLLHNLLQIRGYEGLAGTYSFTPYGTVDRSYLILQVSNGQLVQAGP